MKQIEINNVKSVLELKQIFIKRFSFERNNQIKKEIEAKEIIYKFGKNIEKKCDNEFEVVLSIDATLEATFKLELSVAGIFSVDDIIKNEILIYKNSLSILFPYLRSEITLLTSQPGMMPIVLPPININLFFDSTQD